MGNLTIVAWQSISWDLFCIMDFSSYPVDKQICRYDIMDASAILTMDLLTDLPKNEDLEMVHIMSENEQYGLNSINLDYDAFASLKRSKAFASKATYISMEIRIKRKMLRSFIEIILPPGF